MFTLESTLTPQFRIRRRRTLRDVFIPVFFAPILERCPCCIIFDADERHTLETSIYPIDFHACCFSSCNNNSNSDMPRNSSLEN